MPGAGSMLDESLFSPGTLPVDVRLGLKSSCDEHAPKSITAARPNIVPIANRFIVARPYCTSLPPQVLDV
jgi:hypothetical protein